MQDTSSFVLTPHQALERLIKNDQRNIDHLAVNPRYDSVCIVIADCADHMMSARDMNDMTLEAHAARNLRYALSIKKKLGEI